ncbi:MAG: iron uptake porin, partial [Waterburya sp.]
GSLTESEEGIEQSLSRWEFAAGLNACLNTMERLLQENVTVLNGDLDQLQRLVKEFATELAALSVRVDNLDNRVTFLEDHQFSTTTKLMGTVVFSPADVFGGDGDNNQTVLQQRVGLDLATSFTGQDLLVSVLRAGNAPLGAGFDLSGTSVGGITIGSAEGTLSSQFGGNTGNKLKLLALQYQFSLGEQLRVYLDTSTGVFQSYVPTLNPYLDDGDRGRGSISVFGQRSPIYVIPGGGSGIGLKYDLTDNLQLSAGYLADGLFAGKPEEGRGLFNGGYGALGQITWQVSEQFSLGTVYVNEYSPPGSFGFNYNGLEVTGTAVANTLSGQVRFGSNLLFEQQPVITNAYGMQFSWQPSSKFSLSGWFSAAYPRLIGSGDGEILSYALTLAFPDLGKEGNLLGLVIGVEPYLTSFKGGNPKPFPVDLPLHLEAFYRYQLNNNIAITPGGIWLTAPNQNSSNRDNLIATILTTFQF